MWVVNHLIVSRFRRQAYRCLLKHTLTQFNNNLCLLERLNSSTGKKDLDSSSLMIHRKRFSFMLPEWLIRTISKKTIECPLKRKMETVVSQRSMWWKFDLTMFSFNRRTAQQHDWKSYRQPFTNFQVHFSWVKQPNGYLLPCFSNINDREHRCFQQPITNHLKSVIALV